VAAEEILPIASVTKLVTAAAVYESSRTHSLKLTAEIPHLDQTVSVYDLLFALLLTSSNTAGEALAKADPTLVTTAMPQVLAQAAVTASMRLVDTTGLSDDNQASANALALFTKYLWQKKPQVLDMTVLPQYVAAHDRFVNNNPVAGNGGYRGGKHGYTPAANRTLTAIYDEETSLGRRPIIYVVLGSDSLVSDVSLLRQSIAASTIETGTTSAILP
jgi:D-alanyl-D-alanine carboxypeptidase